LPSIEGDCSEHDCDGTGFLTFCIFIFCFLLLVF
jgi:hypothetical protein